MRQSLSLFIFFGFIQLAFLSHVNAGEPSSLSFYRSGSFTVVGKNRVPLDSFRSFMRLEFLFTEDDTLRAITSDEVAAYTWSHSTWVDALNEHEKPFERKLAKVLRLAQLQPKTSSVNPSELAKAIETARIELYVDKETGPGVGAANRLLGTHIDDLLLDPQAAAHVFLWNGPWALPILGTKWHPGLGTWVSPSFPRQRPS